MATFVLIPGGWHGGWMYGGAGGTAQAGGHQACVLTLSGLDDMPAPAPAGINLDSHMSDVLELLSVDDLSEVILCSHGYGGMVASGVADRAENRLAACQCVSGPISIASAGLCTVEDGSDHDLLSGPVNLVDHDIRKPWRMSRGRDQYAPSAGTRSTSRYC